MTQQQAARRIEFVVAVAVCYLVGSLVVKAAEWASAHPGGLATLLGQ